MSDQDIHPSKYSILRDTYKYYIDSYNALYQLKTEKEEELNSIYKMIKTELIDSKKDLPQNVIRNILKIIKYKNRYTKSYLTLAKHIYDDYHVTEVSKFPLTPNFLFYKEYGIKLYKSADFRYIYVKKFEIHSENTIYRAIMYNDIETFIAFTERDGFDKDQKFRSDLYPELFDPYSLLELCSYHGAVDCFKFLRTKFNSYISENCLALSFLGENPEIMSECLKYQKPGGYCMKFAIASHNIDFVTFLMNKYKMRIRLCNCLRFKNLEAFFVKFDRTNNVDKCFIYSAKFGIPSLCDFFLSAGANINETDKKGKTALIYAAYNNRKDTTELLIAKGANINIEDNSGRTALHKAARYNSKETAELLIENGANINIKDKGGRTALHKAARHNNKETAEILISLGANIDEVDENERTALDYAAWYESKETIELLLSHGARCNSLVF
ncbi:hypothetical protein TVAG_349580 [Trichomonas vaginalis G3]|uniref:DUF3447 domain-containing protein n=1 Tax=Trichomonas vaginalis (strain ATCC PRA-98 / G3) TaxID=412133 RepID=A2EMN5_TRIV3|nr:protein ubiquitination [Trichomonas vaginalis G3]EAY06105.1 hypothetical protein TVAG_349580 [Trichomonas vaginalis G3]KAI5497157.1 protein ubiquitination [Trichomonas vaginalis G3]|eukprot:XP_001318328.1 hypothetical protein [Trichomonas vaginalis G3]